MSESTIGRVDVINQIKDWIKSGEMPPGSHLPTERELSQRMSTQRLTIRRALAALEDEGVVRRVGQRTRIIADRPAALMNSVVIVNSTNYKILSQSLRMPGWAVHMSDGIVLELADTDYNLLLINPDRMNLPELNNIINGRPRGVLFPERAGELDMRLLWGEKLKKANIPVVVYGDEPELEQFDRIYSDHELGSYLLTRHMISLGSKRPLLFYEVNKSKPWVSARYQGYVRAMRESGLEPLPHALFPPIPDGGWASFDANPETVKTVFENRRRYVISYLLDYIGPAAGSTRPDSLLVISDGQIFEVAAACRTLGLQPGKDILIAGYDNYWADSWERKMETVVPSATVDKCLLNIGRRMVQMLLDRIANKDSGPHTVVVPPELCPISDARLN